VCLTAELNEIKDAYIHAYIHFTATNYIIIIIIIIIITLI